MKIFRRDFKPWDLPICFEDKGFVVLDVATSEAEFITNKVEALLNSLNSCNSDLRQFSMFTKLEHFYVFFDGDRYTREEVENMINMHS